MITTGNRPTDQQQAVIDACMSGADLVIEAGAGTGKTSTLQMAATAMTGRTGLYLAYNRATARSARLTFPASITCVTAHSMAYRAAGWRYAGRLPRQARLGIPAWTVANLLGIGEPLLLGDKLILTPAHLARITMTTVERYCYSAADRISGSHVPQVNGLNAAAHAELTWRIVPYAERAWRDIQHPDGRLPFSHDHYLKIWQLTSPVIPADFIMFDEAQDANPATAAIIQNQHTAQQIAVGDSCQAIYGWRGATDALATWPATRRLQLSRSFRFGAAVAAEANKWLSYLGAGYRLSGTPQITSDVGTVTDPNAILCRTNAEALLQARAALDAGRQAALAGGGHNIRLLALAALELQDTGHTSNPELAAFRSWHAVQDYVRTDAAGTDLAASIRLIGAHGATAVLQTIDRLTGPGRAEVTVSTAHRAKGQEWGRVLIASDFREPKPRRDQQAPGTIPRTDAMLAYVAITRARHHLDRTGLAWIDNYAGHTTPRGKPMSTTRSKNRPEAAETQLPDDQQADPGPYLGGRAQAESGSRIIENDYDAWKAVSAQQGTALSADHPRVVQLAQACQAISRHGLGDEPGAAGIRYQVLAHAATALAQTASRYGPAAEVTALRQLADHARTHAGRLRATAERHFLQSSKAAQYDGGRAHAGAGSRIVLRSYQAWAGIPAATQAASETTLQAQARRLHQAWEQVLSHGLADGPGPAAARYRELADASHAMALDFPATLPSAALTPLLELASRAGKHAVRLHATAAAHSAQHDEQAEAREPSAGQAALPGGAYQNLPSDIAARSAQAHSGTPRPAAHSQEATPDDKNSHRTRAQARRRATPQAQR